ncbi:hypothetical protein HY989_04760 [Candidatus Micrarchaeota archaeon]|nr:hypothetical protein [Candidatus Micrarchaeota archaeon]
MQRQIQVLHYPTLKTVLLVEDTLKEAKEPLSRYAIMKRLGNKVMKPTLDLIISYLEERGMVLDSPKGVVWTYSPKESMQKKISRGLEI